MNTIQAHWKKLGLSDAPALHLVLGSGLASTLNDGAKFPGWSEIGTLPFGEVEGLVSASAPGHKGAYKYYRHEKSGRTVCFQLGRLHGYEGLHPRDVVKTVMVPALAGTPKFLLTNASGALNSSFKVGALMVISDHVNMTGMSPLYGENPKHPVTQEPIGPRFPDMSMVYDIKMRERLAAALGRAPGGLSVVQGTYLGLLGPAYETPAEVRLYAKWGLDAVGMSTVWEAMALRHAGKTLAGLSFISNMGCGLSDAPLNHEEVEREGKRIAGQLLPALFDYAQAEVST